MPEAGHRSDAEPPVPATDAVAPKEPPEDEGEVAKGGSDRHVVDLTFSIGSPGPILSNVLSPEAVERLRSDGSLTDADVEELRSVGGRPGDIDAIPGSVQRFEWRWERDKGPEESGTTPADTVLEPATYFEALTGRPDPMRGFFITFRRLLDIATWIIALGLPLGLVALGIATGESSETIFCMGFFGLLVGLMIKRSLPKKPFD